MMRRSFPIVVVCGLVAFGCSSSDKIDLLASNGQQSITRDGKASLISAKRHVVMLQTVGSEMDSNARPNFVLVVRNMQNQPVNISPASASAKAIYSDGTQR